MPNGDKAMRLDEGRILYNDLAERIKNISFSDFATVEETRLIISDYEEEDDEGMVVTANYAHDLTNQLFYYESVETAEEIKAAYKAGKNVIVRLVSNSAAKEDLIMSDIYLTMVGFSDGHEGIDTQQTHIATTVDNFEFGSSNTLTYTQNGTPSNILTYNYVDSNTGKLIFNVYMD